MTERPILFSAPMVIAINEDRKGQTRRVVKLPKWASECNEDNDFEFDGDPLWPHAIAKKTGCLAPIECPYGQPGDRLVVAMEIPSVGRNYCAGSDGVVYSRARGDWRRLKAHGNGNGYPSVTVMDGSRKTTRSVHSLVCEAFYGPAPFNGAQVRHLDGDTSNSEPSNLAWGTQAENWQDRRCHGNGIEGEKHHAAKLSDSDRAHIRWAIEHRLCSQRNAALTLGMTQSAIGQLMEGSEVEQVEQDIPAGRIPRILLEITAIRVERLNDISEADAMAEGVTTIWPDGPYQDRGPNHYTIKISHVSYNAPTASGVYSMLWEQINGPGSWARNEWVWVVEFRRIKL